MSTSQVGPEPWALVTTARLPRVPDPLDERVRRILDVDDVEAAARLLDGIRRHERPVARHGDLVRARNLDAGDRGDVLADAGQRRGVLGRCGRGKAQHGGEHGEAAKSHAGPNVGAGRFLRSRALGFGA
jgi:hypothetical protein